MQFQSTTFYVTEHARAKMRHYALSEQRVKRVIRHPIRIEKGILDGAIAVMQPAESKKYSEIWAMYVIEDRKKLDENSTEQQHAFTALIGERGIRIITAWRYPGKSPERDPVPEEILSELRGLF